MWRVAAQPEKQTIRKPSAYRKEYFNDGDEDEHKIKYPLNSCHRMLTLISASFLEMGNNKLCLIVCQE
ncbi:hypothetical protein ER57_16920 [Smithella sp. SCADC]|nr:hypothetical protein ER57_16920 [Smithella sp. SCADC]